MKLNELKRNTPNKSKKIIGRGGKRGKTSGRGHKGQHQHGSHGIRPNIRDMIKKIPKLRGHGKNKNTSIQEKPLVINLVKLEAFYNAGDTVSLTTLQEKKLIRTNQLPKGGIKILGDGDLTKKLTISGCAVSETAKKKIEAVGGIIE